jgi:hypothetical protein
MPEELMLESFPSWESEEADPWGESIAEAEDSAEDLGERWPWERKQQRRRGRGVRGIVVRNSDGTRKLPVSIAAAPDTNRALANHEIVSRDLERKVNYLQRKFQAAGRNASTVSGAVTLIIGGGLTLLALWEVSRQQGGFGLADWANHGATKAAAVIAGSQVAQTGIKLAFAPYPGGMVGITADIFSGLQLAAFGFGQLNPTPTPTTPKIVETLGDLKPKNGEDPLLPYSAGDIVVTKDTGREYRIFLDASNHKAFMLVEPS